MTKSYPTTHRVHGYSSYAQLRVRIYAFQKGSYGKTRNTVNVLFSKVSVFESFTAAPRWQDNSHCPLQVIAAEGEHKASSALKEAAHVIEESPHALQVSQHFNTVPIHHCPCLSLSQNKNWKIHILKYFTPDSQIRHSSPIMSPTASNMKIPPTLSSSNLVLLAWILISLS